MSTCIESKTVSYESKTQARADNKFLFTCKGDAARKIYHRVGYAMDKIHTRFVGINGDKKVQWKTEHSFIRCEPTLKTVQHGVVDKDYQCLVELTAANDVLSISGKYNNKLIHGDYGDQKRFISSQFSDKEAVAKIQFKPKGQLEVEVDDIFSYCRPTSTNYNKESLRYSCTSTATGPSILVLFPKI